MGTKLRWWVTVSDLQGGIKMLYPEHLLALLKAAFSPTRRPAGLHNTPGGFYVEFDRLQSPAKTKRLCWFRL